MLDRLVRYLSQKALLTTASHLETHSEDILQRWMDSLRVGAPHYASFPEVRSQGQRALQLLLAMIRCPDDARDDRFRKAVESSAAEIGREVATFNLAQDISIDETLQALSLFRQAIGREVEVVLRHRLWIALPADVLRAQERINRAIDVQGVSIAQAYLEMRDGLLHQNRQELENTNQQLLRLHDLSKAVTSSLDLEKALDSIADAVTKLLDTEISAIALLDHADGKLKIDRRVGQRGLLPETVAEFSRKAADTLGLEVLEAGNVRMLANLKGEPFPYPDGLPEIGALLCAPLRARERTLGVIYAADRRPRYFDARAARLLVTLANHAGIALDNARLYEEARHRSEVLATLMQEMHHRIKNNLHTVVDLLTLQGQQQGCESASKCLGDSIGRVKSIAAVHELLSVDNISQTDIKKLAVRLADISTKNKVRVGQRIHVSVQGISIYLPSRQATCLALVLNELLDNAVEHAFPDVDEGEILVSLSEDSREFIVTVKDSGVGFKGKQGRIESQGLGLAIAMNLVEKDLFGSLTFNGVTGTEATIRFSK